MAGVYPVKDLEIMWHLQYLEEGYADGSFLLILEVSIFQICSDLSNRKGFIFFTQPQPVSVAPDHHPSVNCFYFHHGMGGQPFFEKIQRFDSGAIPIEEKIHVSDGEAVFTKDLFEEHGTIVARSQWLIEIAF